MGVLDKHLTRYPTSSRASSQVLFICDDTTVYMTLLEQAMDNSTVRNSDRCPWFAKLTAETLRYEFSSNFEFILQQLSLNQSQIRPKRKGWFYFISLLLHPGQFQIQFQEGFKTRSFSRQNFEIFCVDRGNSYWKFQFETVDESLTKAILGNSAYPPCWTILVATCYNS